jgi:pantoate--beta-alanine ligase
MKIAGKISTARRIIRAARRPVVLVPTMGALHEGHAALIRRARRLAGKSGTVVVSLFVNPIQFGPNEDFNRYPRRARPDRAICRRERVDLLFAPEAGTMYLADRSVTLSENTLSLGLCGAARPGHFDGVCTVVAKLFHIIEPDAAVFGEKDFQQLAVIRRMVRDLDFPVRIVAEPTVREAGGLAMSSRNAYLSDGERAAAPGIYRALLWAGDQVSKASAQIRAGVCRRIEQIPGARIDFVRVVDAETLSETAPPNRPRQVVVAVFMGKTRLIDNIRVGAVATGRARR